MCVCIIFESASDTGLSLTFHYNIHCSGSIVHSRTSLYSLLSVLFLYILLALCFAWHALITICKFCPYTAQRSNLEEPYHNVDIVNAPATSGSNPLALSRIDTVSNAAYGMYLLLCRSHTIIL